MRKNILKKTLVLCSVLSLMPYANASRVADQNESHEPIERIEVVGEKTPAFYLGLMKRTELDFYKQLNKQLDNPEFKVTCVNESDVTDKTSVRMKRKSCLPNYIRNRMSFETQGVATAGISSFDLYTLQGKPIPTVAQIEALTAKTKVLAELAVAEAIKNDPELQALLIKLNDAKTNYEQLKK